MTEPLDLDYLVALAREQQRLSFPPALGGERCARCGHAWHGLLCTWKAPAPCACLSAFEDAS